MECQRALFELDDTVTYLNCAYMSPQLKALTALGQQAVARKAKPWTVSVEDFFAPVHQVRQSFARLIGDVEAERIAIIPSVSYGMANVAANLHLQPEQKIILLEEQFPSNYYTWKEAADRAGASLQIIKAPTADNRAEAWNQALLEAIDDQTALVSMAHIHWADGTCFDLKAIRQKTKAVGAWMVLDGTQSVGALPLNVAELQPDALVCAGYKWLMGPYAMGLAYCGPALDQGRPIEENWINRKQSDQFKGLVNYQPEYRPLAGRYNVGEQSNFILIPMQLAALRQLSDWGIEEIQAYCKELVLPYVDRLERLGCTLAQPAYRAYHLLGIRFPTTSFAQSVQSALEKERILVSWRGSSMRIAPHVYNTREEFERLVECLEKKL